MQQLSTIPLRGKDCLEDGTLSALGRHMPSVREEGEAFAIKN